MFKKIVTSALWLLILSGCAVSSHLKDDAKAIMGEGACYNSFVDTSLFSYQYYCGLNVSAVCAVALAKDGPNHQSCGAAATYELVDQMCLFNCKPTWAQVEALALSRCEANRSKSNVAKPCKLFAKNNDIVWEDYKKEDVKFQ